MVFQAARTNIPTHDDDIGHAGEGGLLYLDNLVLVNAQLLEAFRYVCRNVLQKVLGQVESLQIDQRRKGLCMYNGDLIVDHDECLKGEKKELYGICMTANIIVYSYQCLNAHNFS